MRDMDQATIRSEVDRLAPWYYQFDLRGVRTDSTPPCDDTGHRQIVFPAIRPGFWRGKRVLDVGCAEGAWSFGALAQGCDAVTAFDCRTSHLEKGRFVAKVLGYDRVQFELGSADRWPELHPDARFDAVILCGILYHLPAPWQTIERYCRIAGEVILVSSPVWGGDIGWTRWQELDNIAASEDSLDSYMPNDLDTVVAEFAKHGFVPIHVQETGHPVFSGGCGVVFENCAASRMVRHEQGGSDPKAVDIHVGVRAGEVSVSLYGRRPSPW